MNYLLNKNLAPARIEVLRGLLEEQEEINNKITAFKEKLLQEMQDRNVVKIDTEFCTISRVDAHDQIRFDSAKLKKEDLKLYNKYIKVSPVKASVVIRKKVIKNEN